MRKVRGFFDTAALTAEHEDLIWSLSEMQAAARGLVHLVQESYGGALVVTARAV